jgi:hypothetical protein
MERETGIEPATNSLEGCDSTTELLPHSYCCLPRNLLGLGGGFTLAEHLDLEGCDSTTELLPRTAKLPATSSFAIQPAEACALPDSGADDQD